MSFVAIAVVLSTMHYEGDVTAPGGDYVEVPFDVPSGTVEIEIAHSDGSADVILDWGVWDDNGVYRGWGGGLTDDATIGVAQSSRGYLPGPIGMGTWTVVIGKAKLDAAGGHYSIDVTCRDDAQLAVLPQAPWAPVSLSPERRWYKGDFHVHSIQSGDASATFDEITQLATSRGLDFLNISDHNTVAQHALLAAVQPSLPALLFLRGAEITTYSGHGNAVGIDSYVDHRLGLNGRTIQGVLDDVTAQGGVFIVNHPMLDLGTQCIGCFWNHVDDTPWNEVTGLEIITGNFDIGVQAFVPRALALWDQQLDAGNRIAAIGGSDDHSAGAGSASATGSEIGSPTTLVLADDLSEASIIAGLRAGKTIVQLRGPDDPLVELTMKTASGDDAEIGDDVDDISHAELAVHVTGGDGTFAQLWRDGVKLAQQPINGDDARVTFDDTPAIGGTTRYRVQLIDDTNQPIVVTSHIYAHGIAGPSGGCDAGGGGGVLIVVGALGAVLTRRRRDPSAASGGRDRRRSRRGA